MIDPMLRAIKDIRAASSFDEAGRLLLTQVLDRLSEVGDSVMPRIALLNASLHVRNGAGYTSLLVVPGAGQPTDQGALTSTTAWRWVAEGRSVSIDIIEGALFPGGGAPLRFRPSTRLGPESVQHLQQRNATHAYAVPIPDHTGAVAAMLAIEVSCDDSEAVKTLWRGISDELSNLTTVTGPYLLGRPKGEREPTAYHPSLPVVGKQMASIVDTLSTFAKYDHVILLTGASGTGKTKLALWCHEMSGRATGPFKKVDLGNRPDSLFEAELFGVRKGAAADVVVDRAGQFTEAEGGTLFLDEIQNLSMHGQQRLLQFLDDRRYRPLGHVGPDLKLDARIIVASNVDLADAVERGDFRGDLYHRIADVYVTLPLLDERRDEIGPFAEYFLRTAATRHDDACVAYFSVAAYADLTIRSYRGNLRELESLVRRAFTSAHSQAKGPRVAIGPEHLRAATLKKAGPSQVDVALRKAASKWAEALLLDPSAPLARGHTRVLHAYVLEALVERVGLPDAFHALGQHTQVENRNHQRAFNGAMDQLKAFRQDLGV